MNSIAIVGSRAYPREDLVRAYVRRLPLGTVVVTGGWWVKGVLEPTRGVDRWAAEEARDAGLFVVLVAGSPAMGKGAGFRRNPIVVEMAGKVVAFWDESSRGTEATIRIAAPTGKLWRVFGADGKALDIEARWGAAPF